MLIDAIHDKQLARLLVSRGVPAQDLPSKRSKFNLNESLVRMELEIPGVAHKTISTIKQERSMAAIAEAPLSSAYTLGLSSFPTDQRAKAVALNLMARAVAAHKESRRSGRGLPLWHRVYGGAQDILRDKPISEMPCMLFLTNINDMSSATKLEKVRDLLEKYADIPRVIVSGGAPPCLLFTQRLYYPMRAGVYIGPPGFIKEV